MRLSIVFSLLAATALLAAQVEKPAVAAEVSREYDAVKKSIEQSIGWAIEKDFEAMFRLWADNMFHFWLFSDSKVVGLDNFRKYCRAVEGSRFPRHALRVQGPAHRVLALG